MSSKPKFNPFPYIAVFLGTFLILQFLNPSETVDPVLDQGDVGIEVAKSEYAIGKDVKITLQNNTEDAIELPVDCPLGALTIQKYEDESFADIEKPAESTQCGSETESLASGEKTTISLLDYTYGQMGEVGRYRVQFESGEVSATSPEFVIKEPGIVTRMWRSLIYQPMLNALVAVLAWMPGHNLALSVVILTLIIRTILLVPSQKAMRAQKRMQEVQPELERLKKKYKDDQARLAQETMLLWKSKKVSPLSSCGPLLLQFPILIALFYVISAGLSPDKAIFIYDFLPEFQLADIDPVLFGFDLTTRSYVVFPIIVGGMQFAQMQLMMAKRKTPANSPKEVETANKVMRYMMPLMIAFFTSQLPAAVGLYWATSTFYGVIQQLVINREQSAPVASSDEDDVKVRVISKPKKSKKK